TASTPAWLTRYSPTSPPGPWIRFRTPLGKPASTRASTNLVAQTGVSLEGLKTTVLPQTRAGKTFHPGMAIGKFQGVIKPKTPTGTRMDFMSLLGSSEGTVSPQSLLPSPAM